MYGGCNFFFFRKFNRFSGISYSVFTMNATVTSFDYLSFPFFLARFASESESTSWRWCIFDRSSLKCSDRTLKRTKKRITIEYEMRDSSMTRQTFDCVINMIPKKISMRHGPLCRLIKASKKKNKRTDKRNAAFYFFFILKLWNNWIRWKLFKQRSVASALMWFLHTARI